MTFSHDIPPLNFSFPSPERLSAGYVAKLSRLALRAQLTRRSTSRARVNIRSAMQFSYAMAWLRFVISHISGATRACSSNTRAATRAIPALGIPRTAFGQRQLAGLSISKE